MKGNILIIEDEKKLCDVMKLYLSKEGYEVSSAENGEDGEELLHTTHYDLVILDIMMPKKDGWSLLRHIKKNFPNTLVILTTARGEEEDRVFGLELGADDYMVKPLSMRELVLRVNLRFKHRIINSNITPNGRAVPNFFIEDLLIEEDNRRVVQENKELSLTPKEFDLMIFFIKNTNIVFKREQLLEKVWGYDFAGDTRTVDTHVKNLREKIHLFNKNLKTVWGVGYKLES